jgi:hypothetical protein
VWIAYRRWVAFVLIVDVAAGAKFLPVSPWFPPARNRGMVFRLVVWLIFLAGVAAWGFFIFLGKIHGD